MLVVRWWHAGGMLRGMLVLNAGPKCWCYMLVHMLVHMLVLNAGAYAGAMMVL